MKGSLLYPSTPISQKHCRAMSGLNPTALNISDYDLVLIHGGRFGRRHILEIVQKSTLQNPQTHYSDATLDLTLRRYHLNAKGFRLGLTSRRTSPTKIVMSETPLFLRDTSTKYASLPDKKLLNLSGKLQALCEEKGLSFLPQLARTITRAFTKAKYKTAKEGDFQHMNGLYGAEVLQDLEKLIAK